MMGRIKDLGKKDPNKENFVSKKISAHKTFLGPNIFDQKNYGTMEVLKLNWLVGRSGRFFQKMLQITL